MDFLFLLVFISFALCIEEELPLLLNLSPGVGEGGADDVVSVEEAYAIHANAGGPKALKVLPGGDHRFTRPEDLEEVLNAARDWFKKYLKV